MARIELGAWEILELRQIPSEPDVAIRVGDFGSLVGQKMMKTWWVVQPLLHACG